LRTRVRRRLLWGLALLYSTLHFAISGVRQPLANFYGDFLAQEGDNARARQFLTRALQAPANADRPVWDAGRRAEVRALLAKLH